MKVHIEQSPFFYYVMDDFMDWETYMALVRTFPPEYLFQPMSGIGDKLSFNERTPGFKAALTERPVWSAFYDAVKADAFPNAFRRLHDFDKTTSVKFEFSSLPGRGGYLHPHTDTAKKVSTLVLHITERGWPHSWGGGLSIYRHRTNPDGDHSKYEAVNGNELETVERVRFTPNRAVGFIRTNQSLHGVQPISSPDFLPRRSVTINFIT